MRRILICVLVACFFAALLPVSAGVQPPALSAKSAVLYDPLTDRMLLEVDGADRRGMASTTKIMTALVALELYDPEAVVEIAPQWCNIEGSSIYLQPGEKLRVLDLLYGMLLKSGNDAATALAGLYNGRVEDFVALMNAKAAELGLADTSFENPSGLDGENHYSTARDMARLAAQALENPLFAQIVATQSVTTGNRYLKNHNRLLRFVDGAVGVKTGYTKATGRCLVSAVRRQGRLLVAVTLSDPNDWSDHEAMYAWGFAGKEVHTLLQPGEVGTVPLISAAAQSARLTLAEGYSLSVDQTELQEMRVALCGPRFWYGGVEAGQSYGRVEVWLGEALVYAAPVVFAEGVQDLQPEKGFFRRMIEKIFGEA